MNEQQLNAMAADFGVSVDDVWLRQKHDDLWVLGVEERYGSEFEGEEGVRQFEEAASWIGALSYAFGGTDLVNEATTQLLADAAERAGIMRDRLLAELEAAEA